LALTVTRFSHPRPLTQLGITPQGIVGDIEFKDLRFSYPTRKEDITLDGFNLSVKSGQTVALVGPRFVKWLE
jgi:ABC-type multidrug transport system fused ATPase/permease subunit